MARFRTSRGMALRPIQRIKHVVDSSQVLAQNTTLPIVIVKATDTPVLAEQEDVITGAKVYGVYLKVIIASNDPINLGAVPNCYMIVVKNPGDNLTFPAGNAIGASDNKRFVIHQEMVMMENKGQGSNPHVLFNGVVKIPKGYSRFGPNDQLTCNIFSPQMDIAVCFQAHYKEFR